MKQYKDKMFCVHQKGFYTYTNDVKPIAIKALVIITHFRGPDVVVQLATQVFLGWLHQFKTRINNVFSGVCHYFHLK